MTAHHPLRIAAALILTAGVTSAWAADGQAVYNNNCAMCHIPGLANAPKFGDKAAWAPRLEAGRAALLAAAIKGKGAMPPKAGNPKLSDDEIGAALDHMLAAAK
jgi:cytochrome c5